MYLENNQDDICTTMLMVLMIVAVLSNIAWLSKPLKSENSKFDYHYFTRYINEYPPLKRRTWLIYLIKALRQKEKFRFVRQIWLAPNLVFSIIPPFFDESISVLMAFLKVHM